jgi:hypothetical protein
MTVPVPDPDPGVTGMTGYCRTRIGKRSTGYAVKEVALRIKKKIMTAIVLLISTGLLLTLLDVHIAFSEQSKSKAKTATVRMGTLKQVDSGYVIKSGRTTYGISGQDFSPWLGKKVKVTGTMIVKGKHRVLEVTKIEEVKSTK